MKFLLSIAFLAAASAASLIAPKEDCEDYRKVTDGVCADTCLPAQVGICPRDIIITTGGLEGGTCKVAGYTVDKGPISQKAGPCGTLVFEQYAKPTAYALTMTKFVGVMTSGANPTHYGDPSAGCQTDELAIQVQGLDGDFCAPQCKVNSCPSDAPDGVTAKPQCALQTTSGDKYCALICDPSDSSSCGTATCKSIQGTGICTYDDR